MDRATNGYYSSLRQLVVLGPGGRVEMNRSMAAWQNFGLAKPYKEPLREVMGDAVPVASLWNPDAVLNVDDIKHSRATQERCDKAAACQMLFEDCVFHIVRFLAGDVCKGGCDKLVWTGGCALNCAASMRLGERFGARFFERRRRGQDADAEREGPNGSHTSASVVASSGLRIWSPPTPSDPGVALGACYTFAFRALFMEGAEKDKANLAATLFSRWPRSRDAEFMHHAFYCGPRYTLGDVEAAILEDNVSLASPARASLASRA